jgi:hypothetical protein
VDPHFSAQPYDPYLSHLNSHPFHVARNHGTELAEGKTRREGGPREFQVSFRLEFCRWDIHLERPANLPARRRPLQEGLGGVVMRQAHSLFREGETRSRYIIHNDERRRSLEGGFVWGCIQAVFLVKVNARKFPRHHHISSRMSSTVNHQQTPPTILPTPEGRASSASDRKSASTGWQTSNTAAMRCKSPR